MVVFSGSLSYILLISCLCFKEVQLESLNNEDGDEINDEQFNDCLKQNLIKAIPMWLPAYNPWKLPNYHSLLDTVTSIYDFVFTDIVLEGLGDFYIKSTKYSLKNNTAFISIYYPQLVLRSSYVPNVLDQITFTGALYETNAHMTVNGSMAYVDEILFGLSVDDITVKFDASHKVAQGLLAEMKPQLLKNKMALEKLASNKINEMMKTVPAPFVFRVIESFGQC